MRWRERNLLWGVVFSLIYWTKYSETLWDIRDEPVLWWLLKSFTEIVPFFALKMTSISLKILFLTLDEFCPIPFLFINLRDPFVFPVFRWSFWFNQIITAYDHFAIFPFDIVEYRSDLININFIDVNSFLGLFDHFGAVYNFVMQSITISQYVQKRIITCLVTL